MSDQSLESLLAWLREESRMLGWDMIIAIERDKANLLLRHEYMARFDRGDYLEPISGSVDVTENLWRGVLHDFIFDAPRLMFQTLPSLDQQDLTATRPEALLTMDLMSGALVTMENDNVTWRIRKVQSFDALQGNKLYLHLDMPQTLVIEADGAIKLDFRFAEDFEMDLTGDSEFNAQVSIAFRTLFHELEDERRMYTLLVIPETPEGSLRPRTTMLWPQVQPDASPGARTSRYGSGAILALARVEPGENGTLPGPGYHYLIPEDKDNNHSAVLMLGQILVVHAIDLGTRIIEFIAAPENWGNDPGPQFRVVHNPGSEYHAYFTGGAVVVPEEHIPHGPFYSRSLGRNTHCDEYDRAIHFYLNEQSRISQYFWNNFELRLSNETRAQTGGTLGFAGDRDSFWEESRATLSLVQHYWAVCKNDDLCLELRSITNSSWCEPQTLAPRQYEDDDQQYDFDTRRNYINRYLENPGSWYDARLGVQLRRFYLSNSLHPAVRTVVDRCFGPSLKIQDIRSPQDTVVFGTLNPNRTSFEISPYELIIAPGHPHTFTSDASGGDVRWRVSNIDPTSSAPPGSFAAGGVYWAPPLTSIIGNHTRARISATQGDATAHALVTVVKPLSINPLIATCEADKSGGQRGGTDHIVELFAGLMQEESATINWAIKNPVEDESASLQPSVDGHSCTFTAHAYLDTKKYVLDEVELRVEVDEGGQTVTRTRQALVLASHVGFTLNLHIAETRLAPDALKLIARLADTEGNEVDAKWRLADQSPGAIGEEDGIYVPDPERPEKFALIFAAFGERVKREGYMILLLPYLDFPEELILLSQPYDLIETTVAPAR